MEEQSTYTKMISQIESAIKDLQSAKKYIFDAISQLQMNYSGNALTEYISKYEEIIQDINDKINTLTKQILKASNYTLNN